MQFIHFSAAHGFEHLPIEKVRLTDSEPAARVAAMGLSDFPQLQRLTRRQRLKVAAELWDSAAADDLPVPESHKKLIRSRRASYSRGEIGTVTMEQLRKSIRRRK